MLFRHLLNENFPYLKTEYKALLQVAGQNKRDFAIVMLFLQTGLRVSELVNLRLGDVSLETKELTVRQGKQLSCLSRGACMFLHIFCHSRLPLLLMFDHRIENGQQFAHAGDQGHFFNFVHE